MYQKELLVCFSEDIKMWPSHIVLNWYTRDWLLFNIYVDRMDLYTNINTQVLCTLQESNHSRIKLFLKLRLWVCKVSVIMEYFIIIISEIPCACVLEK